MNKARNRIYELDVARALAALWVVGTHFWVIYFLPFFLGLEKTEVGIGINMYYTNVMGAKQFLPLPLDTLGNLTFNLLNIVLGLGYQGVHIFFVLSGFGLTYSRLYKPQERWLSFLKKRFLRLYPTYWILLLSLLPVIWLRDGYMSLPWRGFLLLDQGVPYTWFMFPLIQFYLGFFVLFKLLNRYSIIRFLTLTLIINVFYTLFIIVTGYVLFDKFIGLPTYPGYLALSRLFEFCLGMAAAKIYVNNPERLLAYLKSRKTIVLAIVCEIMGTILMGSFFRFNLLGHSLPVGLSVANAMVGFGISVIAFNLSTVILKNIRISLALFFISTISYEIYLTHFVGLNLIPELFPFIVPQGDSLMSFLSFFPLYFGLIGICIITALTLQQIVKQVTKKIFFSFGKSTK